MKKILSIAFLMFTLSFSAFGETVKPLYDTKVYRKLNFIYIEDKSYDNVSVTMKCISPDYLIHDNARVKILITDENGQMIWKKTLYNTYLYVFSDGQIQIGKPNFTQMIIRPTTYGTRYYGEIKLEEGIY